MAPTTTEYELSASHPEDLDSGRLVAPGETVKLTDAQAGEPKAKSLIDGGALIALQKKQQPAKKKESD